MPTNYEVKECSPDWKLCAKYYLANLNDDTLINNSALLLLDRDGVLITDFGHVNERDRIEVNSSIATLIKSVNSKNIPISVVTNQAGVAKGKYTEDDLINFNLFLLEKLSEQGVRVSFLFYCPSHPDGVIQEYRKKCSCRKPGSKMLEVAKSLTNPNSDRILMIGDQSTDQEASLKLGIEYIDVRDHMIKKNQINNTLGL